MSSVSSTAWMRMCSGPKIFTASPVASVSSSFNRAVPERHPLDPSGLEPAVLAEGVRVLERALDDVGDALDVGVRVHRPVGARDEAVVVEHPQRPDAHLARVAVSVEGEVPAGGEP